MALRVSENINEDFSVIIIKLFSTKYPIFIFGFKKLIRCYDSVLKNASTGGKYVNGPSVCSAAALSPPKCRQHSAAAAAVACLPRTVHSTAVLQIVDRVLTVSLPPVRPSLSPSGLRTRASQCSKLTKK